MTRQIRRAVPPAPRIKTLHPRKRNRPRSPRPLRSLVSSFIRPETIGHARLISPPRKQDPPPQETKPAIRPLRHPALRSLSWTLSLTGPSKRAGLSYRLPESGTSTPEIETSHAPLVRCSHRVVPGTSSSPTPTPPEPLQGAHLFPGPSMPGQQEVHPPPKVLPAVIRHCPAWS